MIQLFEFLNTCSPLRATAYMVFMLLILFLTYSVIESLFKIVFNRGDSDDESEEAEEYYSGPINESEGNE